MSSTLPFVVNLVNTAFGVTVLAVPYCFHQCGLILGTLLLIASAYASKKSCSFLLRSAQISRKGDFESLGFHVGGFLGKLIIEMSLIGYLVGTAIAWFVIIGDVSPAVVSSLFGIEKTWSLRVVLVVIIGVFVVLPLSLVEDIKSLSSASNVAIAIYTIFVLQLLFSTLPRILSGDWLDGVNFWKPDGVLQCLPIFGISFLCQTVIFVLYEAMPDPSVKKMEHVVNSAMNIVLLLSFTVGFSGYVRYFDDGIEGDLLNNYKHDFISEFIRLGFCISTILSFPLLVFPCRSSINSLMSSARIDLASAAGTFIPRDRFFMITCSLIIGTLICGVLFPSVEFVIALVGATMGAMLTLILPSYIFLRISGEDTSKAEAKVLLLAGICLCCLSTFAVISLGESQRKEVKIEPVVQPFHPLLNPPTFTSNTTLLKPSQEVKKLQVVLDKIEKSNKSKNERVGHEEKKRSIIDEQKIVVPQTNTAEVVQESRKEPVLPQEGIVKKIPAEELKPPEKDTILNRAEKNLMQRDATNSKDTDARNQPAEKEAKLHLPDILKRLSEDADLKLQEAELNHGEDQTVNRDSVKDTEPRDNILKKEDLPVNANAPAKEKERAINDEVRIARERKILNDGEDTLSDGKTITVTKQSTLASNVSVVDERAPLVENERSLEKGTTIQNIVSNITVTDLKTVAIQSDMKPSIKDTNIPKRIRRIQSPLLLSKQIGLSKIKLIERGRRKRSSR